MAKRSSIDQAVHNIMKWSMSADWQSRRDEVFSEHLALAAEYLEMDLEEVVEAIEGSGFGGMLFGMMFEDFLTREWEEGAHNVVDDYLARRGWRESAPGKRYLQELRGSVLSVYELTDVSPGQHCDLVDLVRGGKAVRVHERQGTRNLVKWDRIAARVLTVNGQKVFSGGILPLGPEVARSVLEVLEEVKAEVLSDSPGIADALALEQCLRASPVIVTAEWIDDALGVPDELPELVNRDGEPLLFTELRYALADERRDDVRARLDAAPEWERDEPGEDSWSWLPPPRQISDGPDGGLAVDALRDGERPISGQVKLGAGELIVSTNSVDRAERARAALEELLGDLGTPHRSVRTPEELMEEREGMEAEAGQERQSAIPPEVAADLIHQMMDSHYRAVLDQTIPALDGMTPREAAASDAGRKKVIAWLKSLENSELRRAGSAGQEPYDSAWMWQELGLQRNGDGGN